MSSVSVCFYITMNVNQIEDSSSTASPTKILSPELAKENIVEIALSSVKIESVKYISALTNPLKRFSGFLLLRNC